MIPIPSRLYNAAVGGHVAGADQIIDDKTGLTLDKIAGSALEEKEYISSSNNGMGRVILRKNLLEGINTLTQNMINKSNTIYIIQYDFILGENITVPDNCVLEFDGGSLSNGNIVFNNTKLIGEIQILCSISGTVKNNYISPHYFGLYYNDNTKGTENVAILNQTITVAAASGAKTIIDDGIIYIDVVKDEHEWLQERKPTINVPNNAIIELSEKSIIVVNPNNYKGYCVFLCEKVDNVIIKGGTLIGDVVEHIEVENSGEFGFGIEIAGSSNITISNMVIKNMWGDGIILDSSDNTTRINNSNITIINTKCLCNRRQGLSLCSGINVNIEKCAFNETGKLKKIAPAAGIDIEPGLSYQIVDNIVINNCEIRNNVGDDSASSIGANISGWFNTNNGVNSENIKKISIINTDLTSDNNIGVARLVGKDIYINNCRFNGIKFTLSEDKLGTVEIHSSSINYAEITSNYFKAISFNNCQFNHSEAYASGMFNWIGAEMNSIYFNSCLFRINNSPVVVENWGGGAYAEKFYMFNPAIVNEGDDANYAVGYHRINMINPYFLNCKIGTYMKIDTNSNPFALKTYNNKFSKNSLDFENGKLLVVKDNEGTVVDVYGYSDLIRKGSNGEHPTTMQANDVGFMYYNLSYKKFEQWDGSNWSSIAALPSVSLNTFPLPANSFIVYNLKSLQEVSGANSIVVVVGNVDINRGTFTFPYGCSIYFIGGSLNNGTIDLNGSVVISSKSIKKNCFNLSNTTVLNFFGGQSFYDIDSRKHVTWNESQSRWMEYDSATVGIERDGVFSKALSLNSTDIYRGFKYFCISGASIDGGTTEKTNIPIYYTGRDWVDANGTTVVAYRGS